MRETEGTGTRLIAIGGSAADIYEKSRQLVAITGATFLAATSLGGFALDHLYWAAGSGACLTLGGIAGASTAVSARLARKRELKILEAWNQLAGVRDEFDAAVIKFRNSPTRDNLASLMAMHKQLIDRICTTAVRIFELRKPRKAPFKANIKRIILKPDGRGIIVPYYSPMASTYSDEEDRNEYDHAIKLNLEKVFANYWYSRIFTEEIAEDFFICSDLRALMRDLREQRFKEPNETSAKFFRSLIALPVCGRLYRPVNAIREPWFGYKGQDVAGLICVDSLKVGAFRNTHDPDREYDLNVMKRLAREAFWSFRQIDTISEPVARLAVCESDVPSAG
jgi:hypothetical protein